MALLLAACTPGTRSGGHPATTERSPSTSTATGTTPPEPRGARPRHVVVVVMENLSYDSALATPGFAALAHRYAYMSDYYAVAHPSLPNYLALVSGSTFGIASDCLACYVSGGELGSELSAAGISWGAFMQGVSRPCYLGTSYGSYAAKHDPFRYFSRVRRSPRLCRHILPLGRFYADSGGGTLPRFSFVTPNVCNDGHDCSPAHAASWLSGFVHHLVTSPSWSAGDVLVVTWDEGGFADDRSVSPSGVVRTLGGGGHVLTLVIDPAIRPGTVLRAPLDHYGLLATVERWFGLGYLRRARAWRDHTLVLPGAGG